MNRRSFLARLSTFVAAPFAVLAPPTPDTGPDSLERSMERAGRRMQEVGRILQQGPPASVTPDEVARDRFWRKAFQELADQHG